MRCARREFKEPQLDQGGRLSLTAVTRISGLDSEEESKKDTEPRSHHQVMIDCEFDRR